MRLINVVECLVCILLEVCLIISLAGVIEVQHLSSILHLTEFNRILAKVLDC